MYSKIPPCSSLLLLCMLAGSAMGVFYTPGSGNHYPRIGRRAASGLLLLPDASGSASSGSDRSLESSSSFSPAVALLSELTKRGGVFTQGLSRNGKPMKTFPRYGKKSVDDVLDLLPPHRKTVLERLSKQQALDDEVDAEMEVGRGLSSLPPDFMFLAWDGDDDGVLSKDEFITGMRKYRQDNPLC